MRKRWIMGGVVFASLAVAYTGYWFWLAQTFERNLALWIDQQRTLGYRISYTATEPRGFPFPVQIGLRDVAIEPPAVSTPWRLDTESMELSIAPWTPLSLGINAGREPEYRFRWLAGGRNHEVAVDGLSMVLRLSDDGTPPALVFPVQSVSLREGDRYIASVILFSGDIGVFNVSSHAESSVTFSLSASGIDFLHTTSDKTVETYDWHVSGRIMGRVPPEPLTRALAVWSSEGGHVELTQFNANWEATTTVSGDGTVALDQRLQPVGAFSAVVRGYNEAVDAAVDRGMMTPAQGTAAKLWLGARAEKDERGLKVKLPLTIQDGFVSMGPIKLAQVPRIAWE